MRGSCCYIESVEPNQGFHLVYSNIHGFKVSSRYMLEWKIDHGDNFLKKVECQSLLLSHNRAILADCSALDVSIFLSTFIYG